MPSRRQILRWALDAGLGIGLVPWQKLAAMQTFPAPCPASSLPVVMLAPEDDQLLEELEHACFQFFWEQANPETGLVKDRFKVRGPDTTIVASIAATGFGLTAICIGQQRGYVSLADAKTRVLATLRFLWKTLPVHRGFYFHFANVNTGERMWDSEVSSVDTAILLCGILTCRQHFRHTEIGDLAHQIFNRVDWSWLSEDTSLLPHGWTPEGGFLPYRWENYSELMMMYLLGLGSYSHPLPDQAWDAWKRTLFEYEGLRYIGSFAPLFVHQYSQAWFDFAGQKDRYADYYQNSIIATEVHRRFCIELASKFPDYSDDLWGITASDSEQGYVVWGGPPLTGEVDGTVVPSATGGSIPFLPQACMRVLHNIRKRYEGAWCKYGFVNAFNPLKNWYDPYVIGIDTGVTMVMAENARTRFVWDTFMKNAEARHGMARAHFECYQPPPLHLDSRISPPGGTPRNL